MSGAFECCEPSSIRGVGDCGVGEGVFGGCGCFFLSSFYSSLSSCCEGLFIGFSRFFFFFHFYFNFNFNFNFNFSYYPLLPLPLLRLLRNLQKMGHPFPPSRPVSRLCLVFKSHGPFLWRGPSDLENGPF